MNFLKTPQQKLLEESGMVPASPGMLKTPRQLLLEESGAMPTVFAASGGQINQQPAQQMSPDMLRALIQAYMMYQPANMPQQPAATQPNTLQPQFQQTAPMMPAQPSNPVAGGLSVLPFMNPMQRV